MNKETNAVVGYVPDAVAKQIQSNKPSGGALEVKLEREKDQDTHVRIRPDDVLGVLLGASQKGLTGVQVFLKENATVETFSRGLASDFLKPIRDFSFIKWWRPPYNVIYVHPNYLDQLQQLNRKGLEADPKG
jgi:hypothetical protein